MSHSKYTASERRGILAIAIIALLLVGGGLLVTLINRNKELTREIPAVVEMSEMIDSVALKQQEEKTVKKKARSKKSGKSNSKNKKVYRRRSPLDEPV